MWLTIFTTNLFPSSVVHSSMVVRCKAAERKNFLKNSKVKGELQTLGKASLVASAGRIGGGRLTGWLWL